MSEIDKIDMTESVTTIKINVDGRKIFYTNDSLGESIIHPTIDTTMAVPPRHVVWQLPDGSFQVKKKRGRPLGVKNKPKVQNVG